MTRTDGRRSLYEKRAETTAGRLGLAAARLAHDASALLRETRVKSGMNNKELAEVLELSEGRVSQVLSGDGNVRLSTLARFMGAMGHSVRLVAEAAGPVPVRRPREKESLIEVCYGNSEGVGTARIGVPHGKDGEPATLLWARAARVGPVTPSGWKFHGSSSGTVQTPSAVGAGS